MEPKKYILYCSQVSTGPLKSMLIPYDDFKSQNARHLDILLSHAKTSTFKFGTGEKKVEYTVNNLLKQNYTSFDRCFKEDQHDFTKITKMLNAHAEWGYQASESSWLNGCKFNVISGSNNIIKSYCDYLESNKSNIEIGFLVLETKNGGLNI